jgi:protein-tyrosine phosphatase
MRLDLYEIPTGGFGRLATMARPAGDAWLPEEMAELARVGVTDLVSHLGEYEAFALGLADEDNAAQAVGLRFHWFPIADGAVPKQPDFNAFIETLVPAVRDGGFLVVHCRGGIGRSSITAAAILIRLGMAPGDAIRAIAAARGFPVPDTMEQYDFVMSLPHGRRF